MGFSERHGACPGAASARDQAPFRGKGIRGKSVRIDGFSISQSEPLASLFVVDFRGKPQMETLSQTDAEDILGRLSGFLDAAIRGKLGSEIEESSPGYEVIQSLQAAKSQLDRAKLYLLTDTKLSSRVTALNGSACGSPCCVSAPVSGSMRHALTWL